MIERGAILIERIPRSKLQVVKGEQTSSRLIKGDLMRSVSAKLTMRDYGWAFREISGMKDVDTRFSVYMQAISDSASDILGNNDDKAEASRQLLTPIFEHMFQPAFAQKLKGTDERQFKEKIAVEGVFFVMSIGDLPLSERVTMFAKEVKKIELPVHKQFALNLILQTVKELNGIDEEQKSIMAKMFKDEIVFEDNIRFFPRRG
jgi:hypothetical protein